MWISKKGILYLNLLERTELYCSLPRKEVQLSHRALDPSRRAVRMVSVDSQSWGLGHNIGSRVLPHNRGLSTSGKGGKCHRWSDRCFECKQRGHFRRECPKRCAESSPHPDLQAPDQTSDLVEADVGGHYTCRGCVMTSVCQYPLIDVRGRRDLCHGPYLLRLLVSGVAWLCVTFPLLCDCLNMYINQYNSSMHLVLVY